MQTAVLVVAIGVLAIIAYGDVRTRRIPNVLAAAIATLGLVRMILADDPVATVHTIEASAAVFAGAFLLFWRQVLGGGDAKLLTAMALLVGYHELLAFLFLMSLCGGALALAILAGDRLALLSSRLFQSTNTSVATNIRQSMERSAQTTVPYGVAIAAAGVVTMILQTSSTK